MTQAEAESLVEADLNGPDNDAGVEFALLHSETLQKPYGWVFFYNSREFVETGNARAVVAGNGPVVFIRADRSIHYLGSAHSLDATLAEFEAAHDLSGT